MVNRCCAFVIPDCEYGLAAKHLLVRLRHRHDAGVHDRLALEA
jgi:hypothetical protein